MPYRNLNRTWGGGRCLGTPTGGTKAENLPSSGEMGGSYLYPTVSLPADNGKEICGLITSWPAAGKLTPDENGAFLFSDAPDGTYYFTFQRYVDLVATGSPITVTLIIGPVSISPVGGHLVTLGGQPGVYQPITVLPTSGHRVFSGSAPGITQPVVVVVSPGSIGVAGNTPGVVRTSGTGLVALTADDIAAIAAAVWEYQHRMLTTDGNAAVSDAVWTKTLP